MFKNKTKTCDVLAIYLISTPSLIDYHFSNMSDESTSSLSIIRGRTANSKNVLHLGFRYSKDKKIWFLILGVVWSVMYEIGEKSANV